MTAATAAALTLQAGPGQLLARLRIGQMDCPTEETLIRKSSAAWTACTRWTST